MPSIERQRTSPEPPDPSHPDHLERVAGRDRENLEGWIPDLATEAEVREALEKAFDYRGDITVNRYDGSVIEGYLYDRFNGASLSDSFIRIIPTPPKGAAAATPLERVKIAYADVAGLKFSGRDTAAGKTFEAWVKKYWEKKAAGEKNIGIEAEKLD